MQYEDPSLIPQNPHQKLVLSAGSRGVETGRSLVLAEQLGGQNQ